MKSFNTKDILAAFKRAAKRAREIAIQTGTYLHVSQNGKPVALNPVTMKPVQYPKRQRRASDRLKQTK